MLQMSRRLSLALLIIGCLSAMTGCQLMCQIPALFQSSDQVETIFPPSNGFRVYVNPILQGKRPKRVLLIASGYGNGSYDADQKMINELATQIRLQGKFDVVTNPGARLEHPADNILEGKFSEREIARWSRQYNVDAIGLVKVNELSEVAPLRASLTIAFIDSDQTVVACGVDGVWDLANQRTLQAYGGFWNNAGIPVHEREIRLQSPSSLMKFMSVEICTAMTEAGY